MISPDVVRSLIGVVGNVITVRLFLLPAEKFLKIVKKRSVGELSPDPYLATLLNCMLWVFYALPIVRPNSMLVLTVNGAGLLIEAIYIGIFLVLAPSKERLRMLAVLGVEAAFMAALVSGVLLCAQTHAVRSMIVGLFCVTANSVMYVSPLTVMKKAVETKSVECMPFFLSLMALFNGTCWTAYALIKLDVYIAIPNGICVLLSLAQLILYFCYCPKKEKNVERQAQRHVQPYKRE